MTTHSVRGAARSRGGATDTTMLIWKVIAASPGITRQEIWERVEHGIPAGYARRRFPTSKVGARGTPPTLEVVRRYVLNDVLQSGCRDGTIARTGDPAERRYAAVRPPAYRGNPDHVDETGTRAAEHMAVAEALLIVEKWLARADPDRPVGRSGRRAPVLGPPGRKEYEALVIMARALRAKSPRALDA